MLTEIKNNLLYWLVQIVGWGAYNLIIFVLSYVNGNILVTNKLFVYLACSWISSILLSHFIRYLIIKFNWLNRSIWEIVLYSTIIAIAVSVTFELLQEWFTEYILISDFYVHKSEFSFSRFSIGVFISFIVFSLWYGFYYTYLFIERSRKQEIMNLQFEASRNEIELKNLRAQINPHFLFNSLNSIKALVEVDKDESKKAITKLSTLLRNSIHLSKNRLISLNEELELVKNYLDLEKIRFEDHIAINYDISEESKSFKIPPLMIQTLTENAIKHGLSKREEGGRIEIITKVEGEKLIIKINNSGTLQDLKNSRGIGIENTRKRLAIIYGESANFEISEEDEMVRVHIELKQVEDEN